MAADPSPNESAAKWLRNPIVIVAAVLSTIAGAFRIAGVSSMLIADLLLIVGVWGLITIEVSCSKWIRKTGRYSSSIILATAFVSGAGSAGLAQLITNLKKQQPVQNPVQVPPLPTPIPALAPAPPIPAGPILRVVRYETLPYRVGDPLTVKMYVNNVGTDSIILYGGSHSALLDNVPPDYEERRQLERRLWAETTKYVSPLDRPLKFQTLVTFAALMSEETLTQEKIDRLAKGAVIYMMTILRDRHGKAVITSCFHTDPAGTSLFFCAEHNSP